MKSSAWFTRKNTLSCLLVGMAVSVGSLYNRIHVDTDEAFISTNPVAESAQAVSEAIGSPISEEVPASTSVEQDGVMSAGTVLEIAGRLYAAEAVRQWDYLDGNRGRIHGVLDLPTGEATYFKARSTGEGNWDIEKIAFLGEYVAPRDGSAATILDESRQLTGFTGEILETGLSVVRLGFPVQSLAEASSLDSFLTHHFGAERVEANSLVYPVATPDDPEYAGSWTLAKLELEPVWDAYGYAPEGELGRRAVISVVDNGAPDNGAFHMWTNTNEIADNGVDDDGNYFADDIQGYNFAKGNGDLSYAGSHGSTVSKIAASLSNNAFGTASPASSAALMRVLYYESVSGSHFAAVDGIYYSAMNGADAINCSFVSTSSIMMAPAIQFAAQNDALVVAGAGNDGKDLANNILYPAALTEPNLITVGASNSEDGRARSNYSATLVHVFAPASVTSYSTPLVSSTVALLRALDPDATYSEIKDAILAGADQVEALNGLCVSNGRLNVKGAVESLLGVTLGGGGDPTPPAEPTLVVDSVDVTSLSLSWSTEEIVDSFEVEVSENSAPFSPLEPTGMFSGDLTGSQVEGLSGSTEYVFRIRAVTGALSSNWVESNPVSTLDPEPPFPPGFSVGAVGSSSFDLAWSIKGEVDGFELQISEAGSPFSEAIQLDGAVRQYTLSGLSGNTGYELRLRAVKYGLTSIWTRLALSTLPEPDPEPQPEPDPVMLPPEAPALVIDGVGIGSIDLSWNGPADVDAYELQLRTSASAFGKSERFASDEGGVSLTGLLEDTEYHFRLRSLRDGLHSDWTKSGSVWTLAPLPEAPDAPVVSVELLDAQTVLLSWSAGSGTESVEVEALLETGDVIPVGIFSAADERVEIAGLTAEQTYRFRVCAIRNEVKSSWVESDAIMTPRAALTGQLVHQWSFDDVATGIAADDGTARMDLTVDPELTGEGIGTSATGLAFSGDHDGLRVSDSQTINLGNISAFTLSLWIKLDPNGEALTSCVYEQGGYWRGLNVVIDRGWIVANGWNRPAKESDWRGTELIGGNIPVGEWTHIALVLDAGEAIVDNGLKLYVNGRLADAGPASMLWSQNDQNGLGQVMQSTVYAGRQVRRLDDFQGCLDDVSIWHTALTEAEIEDHIISSFQ